jgi:MFS family permease
MTRFSPSEVAFEGFRLIGRRPGAVAAWALIDLVLGGLVLALIWMALGSELPTLIAQIAAARTAAAGAAPDASWAAPLAMKMRAVQWIVQPIGLLISVMFTCAVYRAMVRPKESRFAFLRIGGDELRLFALGFIYGVMAVVAVIGLVVVGVVAGGIAIAIFAGGHGAGAGWGWFVAVLIALTLFCAAIWVAVRLSLAPPISFAEKRIAIFDSWRLTRGNFWRMFGAYVLTWIFVLIFSMAVMMVFGIMILIGGAMLGGVLHGEAPPDWSKLAPTIAVLGILWLAASAALSAATRAVITAPAMAIYRALSGQPSATSVAYFDDEEEPLTGAFVL